MLEHFWQWLQSLFSGSSNPLERLDAGKLKTKIALLDRDQEKALAQVDALKERKQRWEADALNEKDELRRREKAKQIVALNEEIADKEELLDQIFQQRKLLSRLIRFSERSDRMREYGLDKILGQKLDVDKLRIVIDEATTGASMNMEHVNEATKMLDDAFAYSRTVVSDEAIQQVLDDWARADDQTRVPVHTESTKLVAQPKVKSTVDVEIDNVLKDINRRETE